MWGAVALLATATALSAHCDDGHDPYPTDGDADVDTDADADSDEASDADDDAEVDGDISDGDVADGDIPTGPGPMTLLVQRVGVVTDRLCDLDGDGALDNAVADLGASAGEMAAMVLSTALQSRIEETGRIIVYVSEVADRGTPHDDSVVPIIFDGVDLDDPEDPSDDWSGEEPYYVHENYLDACGEPLHYFAAGAIDNGEISASGGAVLLDLPGFVPLYTAAIMGTIAPGAVAGEFFLCGYGTISDLGASSGLGTAGDLSLLEVMLAGGAALGVDALPGIDPDVDLDGDGIESFVLDDEGRISRCVDGDRTAIEGRDCWQNERMADAMSLTIFVQCTSARFAGPVPGWERMVEGTCTDPPEESLWGEY